MKPPTSEEILEAWKGIDRDGPQADTTLRLAALALTDPVLKNWLKKVEERLAQIPDAGPAVREGARTGALIYGLNLGLRIGEARELAVYLNKRADEVEKSGVPRKVPS